MDDCGGDRGQGPSADEDRIRRYLRNPFIELVEVERRVGELARDLQWAHRSLIPHDAVHLACALVGECDILFTYDKAHLLGLDGKVFVPDDLRGGRPWRPLRILEPRWGGANQLSLVMEQESEDVAIGRLQSDLDAASDEELDTSILGDPN